ncbi:hypothetical protein [Streptomyces sp. NPDC021608]|uniref:hypothetical protein n=1 Tax=Streptomyces sp. NPDC021608 TaxID=3154903 RepID=UPI0033C9BD2B
MPEENTPATTPDTAPAPTPARTTTAGTTTGATAASAARAAGVGCAVLLAVPLLLALAFAVWIAVVTKDASDFPRAAARTAADRLAEHSQEAYDVLGFTRAVAPGQPVVGDENVLGSDACYRGGLTDEEVGGAYRMYHRWALADVPAGQARAGLRRLRDHLDDAGWDITSYGRDASRDAWELEAARSDGEERISFAWSADRGSFTGFASAACAVDPGWREGDDRPGEDLTPPALRPSAA